MKQIEDIKAMIRGMMNQEMENFKESVNDGEADESSSPVVYTMLQVLLAKIERDADFRLKDKHYERMEHCIGLDGGDVKDDLYKAYRNSVTYYECVPEWEDLVRNGYARRSGEVGHSIFYSVTRKGFKAIARRKGIRIRYEIEINP